MTSTHTPEAANPRHRTRIVRSALTVALALCASLAPASARAASPITWSSTAIPGGGTPTAVSCASESLCVAVNHQGAGFSTSNPTSPSPTWSATLSDPGHSLNAVSCAPGGLCVVVDNAGSMFASVGPSAATWSPSSVPGGGELTGVSCPSASLCVAVDEAGSVFTSTSPAGGWTLASSHPGHLRAVSCASQTLCVAVGSAGDVFSTTTPTGKWEEQKLDSEEQLVSVSCSVSGTCVAVDHGGRALACADPVSSAPTWSLTPIDSEHLTAVSCASSGLCVAVDTHGLAWASDDPTSATPSWASSTAGSVSLAGVSCLAGGLCMAVNTLGSAVGGRVSAPEATTVKPTEVTEATANLAGVVNPNDAVLGACAFEFGTSVAYVQTIPCAVLPAALGGAQSVSAQIMGLAANTTYHYRVTASSPSGTTVGADEAFTTAVNSLVAIVHPNPSISGTPANGQHLTCHPGTPSGTTAQLTYAWLRDLIPIPGAVSSTYTVKGQDTGHHLQCQVTATDGGGSATAKSAFVTIPVGGVPVSAGETAIGRAAFRNGKLSVPVSCSAQASGGCQVMLRLTLAGGTSHHRTVTLASVRVHLPQGGRKTVAATLDATGRRLLAARRHLSAYVTVLGTVIGVIEAQLSRQLLTLSRSAHGARASAAGRAGVGVSSSVPGGARGASASVLAATPYMGWDTYFALGGNYSESTILEQASQLVALGLERHGYRYVWLDAGWWHGTRNSAEQITVSPKQWPHGLAWLTRTLHATGFLVGIYTDAGPNGCGGAGQGSYGHYQQDANTFAAWGFDAVKVDFCGGAEYHLNPVAAYSAFHAAIAANSSHRPMLLSICNFLQPEQYGEGRPVLDESAFASYSFGPSVGNSWRTDTDVGFPGNVPFTDVLRNIDADAAAPQAAGPGHWNDPDYLAPGQGMSAAQFRSQLSMWAMLAAPLMISDDLTKISAASLQAVQSTEVIAIDQDPGGVQGRLLSSAGNGQVWVKPLTDGSRAVALLNRSSSATKIQTSTSAVGLPPASSYALHNVWTQTTSTTSGSIVAEVPPDSTVLLRASAR
jgi:hypothetical protein